MIIILPLFNLRHPLNFKSTSSRTATLHIYAQNASVLHIFKLFSDGHGSFLALSVAGDVGGARDTTNRVRAPAELRGACSGRPTLRELPLFLKGWRSDRPNQAWPWKSQN